MGLYEHLADAYDALFPQQEAATKFLDGVVPVVNGRLRRVLDLGSATGAQLRALAERGWEGMGLEPSDAMLVRAREKTVHRRLDAQVSFHSGGMLDVADLPNGHFDLVLCLGNTLPHLRDAAELQMVLTACRRVTKPGGALVLQLLNYTPILAAFSQGRADYILPPIIAGELEFGRRYTPGGGGALVFQTELARRSSTGEPNDPHIERDETRLLPITYRALLDALVQTGYTAPCAYADWSGAPFREAAAPFLVLVAHA